ncbi:MAG: ATP-dependent helicase HrpB, partial [Deltaproteobacteria bacterium]
VRPLHGSLPLSAQAEAVRRGVRPRIVLATNVAESSVTVEGVGAVVDTGRARVAAYDPALGETVVALRKVARAACEQRAGRAGREGPGVVVRLYSAADLARRPAYEVPEILRASLGRALLDLACANAPPLEALPLLDPPPPDRVSEGLRRLHRMGALDDAGRPTEVGRALAALPVDLPLGRLVLAGIDEQIPWLAARVAAYLDLSRGGAPARRAGAGLVDMLADLRTLEEATDPTSRRLLRDVERVARRLAPRGATDRAEDPEQALCRALLAAMPERLARVHADGRMAMVSGASARLVRASLAHGADLVVAVAAEHRRVAGRDEVVVTSAAAVDEETVVDVLTDRCEEQRTVRWDPAAGRAVATVETRLGSVLLERRDVPPRDDEVRAARAAALAEVDFAAVPWSETLEVLRARAEAGALADVRAALADEAVRRALVAAGFDGRIADPSLADPSVLAAILLSPAAVARLDEAAPSAVRLANGVWVRVRYARGSSPWIEAPIQWLFGLRRTPEIAGRPVTVHLLAPNRRAVQVTSDLPGFWIRHYPQLARALRRRYPKHPFPDDPVGASPPPRAPRRPPRS